MSDFSVTDNVKEFVVYLLVAEAIVAMVVGGAISGAVRKDWWGPDSRARRLAIAFAAAWGVVVTGPLVAVPLALRALASSESITALSLPVAQAVDTGRFIMGPALEVLGRTESKLVSALHSESGAAEIRDSLDADLVRRGFAYANAYWIEPQSAWQAALLDLARFVMGATPDLYREIFRPVSGSSAETYSALGHRYVRDYLPALTKRVVSWVQLPLILLATLPLAAGLVIVRRRLLVKRYSLGRSAGVHRSASTREGRCRRPADKAWPRPAVTGARSAARRPPRRVVRAAQTRRSAWPPPTGCRASSSRGLARTSPGRHARDEYDVGAWELAPL